MKKPINFDNIKDEYIDDYLYDETAKKKINLFKRLFYSTASLLSVILLISAGVFAYRIMATQKLIASVPLIQAEKEAFKRSPQEPGGAVSNLDKKVYNKFEEEEEEEKKIELVDMLEDDPVIHIVVPTHEEPLGRTNIKERVGRKVPSREEGVVSNKQLATVDDAEVRTILKAMEERQKAIEKAAEEIQQTLKTIEEPKEEASVPIKLVKDIEAVEVKEKPKAQPKDADKQEAKKVNKEIVIAAAAAPDVAVGPVPIAGPYNREATKKSEKEQFKALEEKIEEMVEEKKKAVANTLLITEVDKVDKVPVDNVRIDGAAEEGRLSKDVQMALRYRIQLGAFKSETDAKKAWGRLRKQNKEELGTLSSNIIRADLGNKGVFYRLQAGKFSREADARRLCTKLQEKQQGCFVVK